MTFDNLPAKQAAAFEQIATGNDRGHHPATLRALVNKGYISEWAQTIGRDGFGDITVMRYEVPIPVHIRWCEWCSENYADDEIDGITAASGPIP